MDHRVERLCEGLLLVSFVSLPPSFSERAAWERADPPFPSATEPNRIFCHSQNLFWSLEQIDQSQIEAPKVPSGMTGGVEYEAMAYCASSALASRCFAGADFFVCD